MDGGLVRDPEALGSAVRQLLASQGLSKGGIVSGVTGLRAISRVLAIPPVKPSMLESVVLREARREMPLPLDEIHLSWQPMGAVGNQQRVFMLGVPTEMIDGQVDALRQAGIRPKAMDLKPLALVRAINRKNAIIVNLEESTLDIIIVVENVPVIVRSVGLGKESPTLEEKQGRLTEELSRTIKFYNDSHREARLHPGVWIYASGALAEGPRFRATLGTSVDHVVVAPQPVLEHPAELPVGRFLVNMGLALKRV
jgi:type IV pilus assembly protein PilM